MPAIAPQETAEVALGFNEADIMEVCSLESLSAHDVYLNVRYVLRRADGILTAGSEVAYDQICLNEAAAVPFEDESGRPEYVRDGNMHSLKAQERIGLPLGR